MQTGSTPAPSHKTQTITINLTEDMTVQQLIDELLLIEDKTKPVKIEQPAYTYVAIENVYDGTRNVYINV